MRVLSKEEFKLNKFELIESIEHGAIFIYPTDTIYGIGCNAKNKEAVGKIREIKERKDSPFSVIAPSKEWIHENCEIDGKGKEWVDKLPGALTLICNLKNECVAENVNPSRNTLGIRMPDNWFTDIVKEIGLPIVTTSVNKSGQEYMTSLENLDEDIGKEVSFVVYDDEKNGKPSKIIDLTKGAEIRER